MTVFSETLESERLRFEIADQEQIDPLELYKRARSGAPDIEKVTEFVT